MLEKQKANLEGWRNRIANALKNIEDLLEEWSLQLIRDKQSSRKLRKAVGKETREQLEPALETLVELWGSRALVTGQIGAAQLEYEKWETWEGLKKAAKLLTPKPDVATIERTIDQLLDGESVQLPPIQTPRAQRKLGSPSAVASKVTPETFWNALEEAYDELNTLVVRITTVQDRWGKPLRDVNTNLTEVKQLAGELNVDVAALKDAATQIETWRAKVYDNPLTFFDKSGQLIDSPDNTNNIVALLETALQELKQRREQKERLTENIQTARVRLGELSKLRQQVSESWQSVSTRVLNPENAVAPDDDTTTTQLSEMLTSIEGTAGEGNWQPATRALQLWDGQIGGYETFLRNAVTQNQASVIRRSDMRTDLGAWQAKAGDNGYSEHPEVVRLTQELHTMLYSKHTNLLRAEQLMTELRQLVIGLSKTGAI